MEQDDEVKLERQTVTLGGRRFRVIDFDQRTVAQDHYLMREIRRTGIDKVLPMNDEPDEAYLVRLQTHLIDSGRACLLISAYLLPEDKKETDWTPRMGAEIAAHIERCNTAEDREVVIMLAMEAVFGFFRQGLEWLKRFPSSSVVAGPQTNAMSNH